MLHRLLPLGNVLRAWIEHLVKHVHDTTNEFFFWDVVELFVKVVFVLFYSWFESFLEATETEESKVKTNVICDHVPDHLEQVLTLPVHSVDLSFWQKLPLHYKQEWLGNEILVLLKEFLILFGCSCLLQEVGEVI